jgi:hypothetical protein
MTDPTPLPSTEQIRRVLPINSEYTQQQVLTNEISKQRPKAK